MGQSSSEMIEEELAELSLLCHQWERVSQKHFFRSTQTENEAREFVRMGRTTQAKQKLQISKKESQEGEKWAERAYKLTQVKDRVMLSQNNHLFAKSSVRLLRVLKNLDTDKIDEELALFDQHLDQLGQAGESLLDEQETGVDVSLDLQKLQEEEMVISLPEYAPPSRVKISLPPVY